MYVLVYSPDGEPFEVTRDRADHLLLNEGWTQTKPKIKESVEDLPLFSSKPKRRPSKRYKQSSE